MAVDKKQIVKDINASFSNNDVEGFLSHCDENFTWTMVGEGSNSGKAAIREWMKGMDGCEPPVFGVSNLVEDGDVVVCSGDMSMKDKEGKAIDYSYCDIYSFKGDTVVELTSFVVPTDAKKSTASA